MEAILKTMELTLICKTYGVALEILQQHKEQVLRVMSTFGANYVMFNYDSHKLNKLLLNFCPPDCKSSAGT